MKDIYFNDRDGHTILSRDEKVGLLLNHITHLKELDEAEQININSGLLWLSQQKTENILDEKFLKKLHSKLFGKVWKWAGSFRQSEKNIGVEAWKIPTELYKLLKDTEYWLENKTYPWVELIARFHHRLVYIHPFPNGNGRFARILTNHLCSIHGQEKPSWRVELPPHERRKQYIEALQQADNQDISLLVEFLN